MTTTRRMLTIAAALLVAAPVGTALADPPPWAPAHGYRAQHAYVYYPAYEIYYEPATTTWFWFGDGNWRFGAELPVEYRTYTTRGVRIDLDVDRPYVEHVRVVEYYGGKGKAGKRHKAHKRHGKKH